MQLKQRIKKVESQVGAGSCLCAKGALLAAWIGKSSAPLVCCPRCKPQFDEWCAIADEARHLNNLTDQGAL